MAADFIMRREDIDTVLVYGIVEDRIDGSLRTSRASVDPAGFMQNAFGADSEGRHGRIPGSSGIARRGR